MKNDIRTLPDNTLLVFTDFSATLVLRALEAKNSSVDAHAVLDNFVCLYKRRKAKVKEKDKEEEVEIFTCDVHHFFADTISAGKKSDHVMHNTCFDVVIPFYERHFKEELGTKLEVVKVWTDNAPTQYRCRQNFLQVAKVKERHPNIKLIHRLAVVDNFKGAHDSYGKDPKRFISKQELNLMRSPNALGAFIICNSAMRIDTKEDNKWKDYEKNQDVRLKGKGTYGMDGRYFYMVVETQNDLEALSQHFPGQVILCNRKKIEDTVNKAPIKGTTKLHEVCSYPYEKKRMRNDKNIR